MLCTGLVSFKQNQLSKKRGHDMKRTIVNPIVCITAVIMFWATTAWSGMLVGTTGAGQSDGSTLVEIDPATGETLRTIGPVGYKVNGLEYDATTRKLYGSTSVNDPNYNGLIEIDIDTGAGTAFGKHGWGLKGKTAVTNITVDSTGRMFGWWDWQVDDLVRIDKTTGIATRVGESNIQTAVNGLDFDNSDTLYMVNLQCRFVELCPPDNIYTVDLTTGAASSTGGIGTTAHHGDFDPSSNLNLYYGITDNRFGSGALVVVDFSTTTLSVISTFGALDDNIHVITFIDQDPVAVCQDVVLTADSEGYGSIDAEDLLSGFYGFDGDEITITADPGNPYYLGETEVEVTVTDEYGAFDTCDATVTVESDGGGTPDCPGQADSEAYVLIESANDILWDLLPTGDKKTDKQIEKAIKHIEKSLADKLWEDNSHLTKEGKKVFDEDKKAVKEFNKIIKDKDAGDDVKDTVLEAICYLITANQEIASTAVDEAIELAEESGCDDEGNNDHACKKTLKEINKAQSEMIKAQNELDHIKKDGTPDPKYDKAIDHYKKAWEHAQHAQKAMK
jgi:hypothetical protein